MFQLDFGDHRPLYEQIKEKFKELIISGAMTENDKIPSVRELAATLAINPNTIQKHIKTWKTRDISTLSVPGAALLLRSRQLCNVQKTRNCTNGSIRFCRKFSSAE